MACVWYKLDTNKRVHIEFWINACMCPIESMWPNESYFLIIQLKTNYETNHL